MPTPLPNYSLIKVRLILVIVLGFVFVASIASMDMHYWLPLYKDEASLADSAAELVGKRLTETEKTILFSKLADSFSWNFGIEQEVYVLDEFTKWDGLNTFLVARFPGTDPFFSADIYAFIIEPQGSILSYLWLAGYAHGDGGGIYRESWYIDSALDGQGEFYTKISWFGINARSGESSKGRELELSLWNGSSFRALADIPENAITQKLEFTSPPPWD